ncbi:phage major tail protein, TP901-1 family [Marinilactibacillus psychrotolerans]|uniref:Phage major tail protein, TP901-1 family n=1 Tax=Marinilactibacillus psychrotolerans TaxID=191770 RepID=A0A5R9C063_9LACT|nr:phage major tail protein, TP901-1 family [Marinilactibacillus psychrotolerans]TLQ06064.1 phage major tail protein, TP901-1 family [Marinilactibacillus psychrotolerans]
MAIIKTTAAPVKGFRVWYFIQAVTAELGSDAILPAFQTEGGTTLGGDNIDEQTKQGRIIQKSTDEQSVDLTQYFVPSDPASQVIEQAKVQGLSVKVWRVVIDENSAEGEEEEKTYPAKFGYGLPEEIEYSDGEDLVEISYTLQIVGRLQDGRFPLTDEDVAVIENMYDYQNPGETTGNYDAIEPTPPVDE